MGNATKWASGAIAILVVGAVSVSFLLRSGGGGVSANSSAEEGVRSEEIAVGLDKSAEVAGNGVIEASSQSARPILPRQRIEQGYNWNPARPGEAASEEDANWLAARGFPGPDVYDYLKSIPQQELKRLVDQGNHAAIGVYAQELARQAGNRREILEILHSSAESGAIYALKTGGDIFTVFKDYRDPVMAATFYNLQGRAGDQGGFVQSYVISQQMSSDQRLLVNAMTEQMWRSFEGTRLENQSGNVRPGYNQFLTAAAAANKDGG